MNLAPPCHRLAFASASGAIVLALSVPAAAGPPDPRTSVVEALLVGAPSGHALPGCDHPMGLIPGFQVEVRDVVGESEPGRLVTLDFSATPMRLFADARSGTTVNCAAGTVSRLSDAAGLVTFSPRVGGSSAGSRIVVSADGVILAEIPGRSTDFDGDGLTGLSDFALLATHFRDGSTDPRTDLDGCSAGSPTSLTDFAIFGAEFNREVTDTPCR